METVHYTGPSVQVRRIETASVGGRFPRRAPEQNTGFVRRMPPSWVALWGTFAALWGCREAAAHDCQGIVTALHEARPPGDRGAGTEHRWEDVRRYAQVRGQDHAPRHLRIARLQVYHRKFLRLAWHCVVHMQGVDQAGSEQRQLPR